MTYTGTAALAVAAWYSLLPSLVSSAGDDRPAPPRVPLRRLRSAGLHELLHDSRGILRLAVDGDGEGRGGLAALRRRALGGLCDCPTLGGGRRATSAADGAIAPEEALRSHPKDLREVALPDGTVRRTLASATVVHGGRDGGEGDGRSAAAALELPGWVADACGPGARDALEDLRDAAADAADAFVEALDREKGASGGDAGGYYGRILSGADHLEHFHVYAKPGAPPTEVIDEEEGGLRNHGGIRAKDEQIDGRVAHKKETSTLDYHTDAGFFLAFVPAMDCRSYATDTSSFYLEGQGGPVAFEEDEVIIMLGAGAQHWLPPPEPNLGAGGDPREQFPFVAASHALRLSPGAHRAWYGKMHLLPASFAASNVDPRSPASVQFGEVLPSFQMKDYDAHVPASPVDGCGTTYFNANSPALLPLGAGTPKKSRRRRLQHVNSPSSCNNVTSFFCWYQCIDIPDSDRAEQYVQEGYSLYCLDPAKLASSENPIADATTPCENGYVHNSNCIGSWQVTDKEIPGYKLPYEVKQEEQADEVKQDEQANAGSNIFRPEIDDGEKYCYGGTSMYMDGFTWQGTTCVIYLFQSWVLSTPGKFAAASIGSILFGVLLEFVLWRRRSVYALPPGTRRLCLSAMVYGVQLSMGYFIMLVIMTYSGPLFICTVGGMMLGHISFNAQDALVKGSAEKEKESKGAEGDVAGDDEVPACCENTGLRASESHTELSSYQNGANTENGLRQNGANELEGGIRRRVSEQGAPSAGKKESKKLNPPADGVTPCCQYTL